MVPKIFKRKNKLKNKTKLMLLNSRKILMEKFASDIMPQGTRMTVFTRRNNSFQISERIFLISTTTSFT